MKRKVSLMIIVILLLQVLLPLLTVIWESDFTLKSEAVVEQGAHGKTTYTIHGNTIYINSYSLEVNGNYIKMAWEGKLNTQYGNIYDLKPQNRVSINRKKAIIHLPKVASYKISSIADFAFQKCDNIQEIVADQKSCIGNELIIGQCAFDGCSKLETVDLNTFCFVKYRGFNDCISLRWLDDPVFSHTLICGTDAEAFRNCSSIEKVTLMSVSWRNNVCVIGQAAFINCKSLLRFEGEGFIKLSPSAFQGSGLKAFPSPRESFSGAYFILSSNVIPSDTFAQCKNLETVDIYTGNDEPIESVGDRAFAGCPKLTSLNVTISNNCDLGKEIFKGSGVSYFKTGVGPQYNQGISGSTQKKLDEQKIKTKEKKTTVPDKKTTGGGSSTPNTKNVSDGSVNKEKTDTNQDIVIDGITWTYTLKDGKATKVKPKTKADNKTTVNIPDKIEGHTVTTIGANAFEGWSNLNSVKIPKTVTKIEKEAFKDCTNLSTLDLPKKLVTIEDYAFQRCTSLGKVTIKKNVNTVGEGAFKGCSNLKKVRIKGAKTKIGNEAFKNCSNLAKAIFYKKPVELRNRCICRMFSITCYLCKKELSCKNLCRKK